MALHRASDPATLAHRHSNGIGRMLRSLAGHLPIGHKWRMNYATVWIILAMLILMALIT